MRPLGAFRIGLHEKVVVGERRLEMCVESLGNRGDRTWAGEVLHEDLVACPAVLRLEENVTAVSGWGYSEPIPCPESFTEDHRVTIDGRPELVESDADSGRPILEHIIEAALVDPERDVAIETAR